MENVLPFFRSHLQTLGYREWDDAFNNENIPSSKIDKSYHLELGSVSSLGNNQIVQSVSVPVTARVYFKAFKKTSEARDLAIKSGRLIVERILLPKYRVTGFETGLKNIELESMTVEAGSLSNDNVIRLNIACACFVSLDTCG
jgi:hypothetical protein